MGSLLAALLPRIPVQDGLPGDEEVKRTLEDILSTGEYDTGPQDRVFSIWEWLFDQVRQFFRMLSELGFTSPALMWTIVAVCLVVLAAIFAHGALIVYRALRASRSASPGPGARGTRFDDPRELLRRAGEEAGQGRYAEGIRLCHRAALLGMDRRGLVRYHESFTTGDYRGQLRARAREGSHFETIARVFEPVFFGRAPAGRQEYDRCRRAAGALAEEVRA